MPLLQKQNNHLLDLLHDKRYYILTNLSVDVPNNPIAKKLLERGMLVGEIAMITGLSSIDIEAIAKTSDNRGE